MQGIRISPLLKMYMSGLIPSIIQSAKLNGLDPYAYLNDVLKRLPTHKVTQIVTATPLGTWTELKNSDGVQRMLTKIWGEAHDFLLNLNCFNSISITLTSSKIYILGGFFTWFLWLDLIIYCWNCLWKLRGCN